MLDGLPSQVNTALLRLESLNWIESDEQNEGRGCCVYDRGQEAGERRRLWKSTSAYLPSRKPSLLFTVAESLRSNAHGEATTTLISTKL